MNQWPAHILDNDVSDYTLYTVASLRETRKQINENTKRLAALEQRLAALEPQPEPELDDEDGDEQ